MGVAQDALMQVRASLCADVDAIDARLADLDQRALSAWLDSVRRTADAHQLIAVALLARACEAMVARRERGAMLRGHLELMREALGCDSLGESGTEAFLAAAAVRLGDGSLLRRY